MAGRPPPDYRSPVWAGFFSQHDPACAPPRPGSGLDPWRCCQASFSSESFDLVYCVNALHHFNRQRPFVQQVRYLLRPGGALAVVGMNPRSSATNWYIYEYFEGTLQTDLDRFVSWGTILDWMAQAGFSRSEWQRVTDITVDWQGWDVLQDPFLEKNATSQLTLLSDAAYAAGLSRIRSALEEAEGRGGTLVFPNTIRMEMLVGWI